MPESITAQGSLWVEITAPSEGEWFCVNDTFWFWLNLTIRNDLAITVYCVSVTIEPGDNVDAGAGCGQRYDSYVFTNEMTPGSQMGWGIGVFCCGPGDSTINVTPHAYLYDNCTGEVTEIGSDSVTIHQEEPHLKVTIEDPPDGAAILVCQDFEVWARIDKTGPNCTAYCVNGTIAIGPDGAASTAEPLTKHVGTLAGTSVGFVNWTLHCNGPGPVTITVTPSGFLDAGCTQEIPAANLESHEITVFQGGPSLDVEIIAPETIGPDDDVDDMASAFSNPVDISELALIDVCQNFEVRAIVTNNLATPAVDVKATILYDTAVVEWVAGDSPSYPHEQNLGTILPGCAVEVAWTLHCKNAGATEIRVEAVDAAGISDWDAITVWQMIKVEITTPDLYCPGYEVCPSQTFTVKAEVTNTGADTVNVTDIELIAFDADWESGPTPDPYPDGILIPPGESRTFTWTLHCLDRSDDTIIVVVWSGPIGAEPVPIGYALYAYHQRGLLVDIVMPEEGDVFCECEDFYVNAVITNTCDDTMYDVWAMVGWEGPVELGQGETSNTTFVGEIAGKTSADVWWELHCTGAGEALIYVVTNGTTEFGQVVFDCDSVLVWQDVLLEVEIIEPPFVLPDGSIRPPDGFSVCECDNFVVKANVTNIGCDDAEGVTVYIDIGGPGAELAVLTPGGATDPDHWHIDDLDVGDWVHVAWNLHCNESGVDVPITVYAESITPGVNLNDTVVVHQGEEEPGLEVLVVSPMDCEKFCTHCYNEFTVTAILSNPACALVQYAFAELQYSCGPGDVTILSPRTQGPFNIGGLSTIAVSWDVACTGAGDVTFWVEAWAQNVDPVESINERTIHQKDFIVEITEVAGIDLAPVTLSTCQEFTITARFINCHETTQLVNIQAILDYSDVGAVPVPGSMVHIKYCNEAATCNETEICVTDEEWIPVEDTLLDVPPYRSRVILDRICPCCCAEVTWTLECVSAISGELTVTALTSGGVFPRWHLLRPRLGGRRLGPFPRPGHRGW